MKFSTSLNRIKSLVQSKGLKATSKVCDILEASVESTRLVATAGIYNRMIAAIEVGLFQLARALSDTGSVSESGVILKQDYTDSMTYFEDDYVGTKDIF